MIDWTKPIETKEGHEAFYCGKVGVDLIVYAVKDKRDGRWSACCWKEADCGLFIRNKKTKRTLWVAIFSDSCGGVRRNVTLYDSEKDANHYCGDHADYLGAFPVEMEY